MTKRITALLLAILVFASLAMIAGCSKEPAETVPSGTTTSPTQTTVTDPTTLPTETTVPPTTVPPTTAPPETTVPPTTAPPPTTVPPATNPPSTGGEMIGSLYTRDQLMAMENNGQGYGPGSTKDGVRPSGAVGYQSRYGQYGGNFIGEDNGKIYIEADALATDIMDVIGVESITIYEKQSDGYDDDVYVYTRYNTAGMTRANNVEHFKSVTYQGTVGKKYYATVAFYAENDEGSETLYHDTYVVTAVSVAP